MLRQVYESRGRRSNLEAKMALYRMQQRAKLDRTETSFASNARLTQKQFKEYMKHADEVAKKWLGF